MGRNIYLDGMMGLVTGDALGTPVQFLSRDQIRNRVILWIRRNSIRVAGRDSKKRMD